jgi:hypothetical protein
LPQRLNVEELHINKQKKEKKKEMDKVEVPQITWKKEMLSRLHAHPLETIAGPYANKRWTCDVCKRGEESTARSLHCSRCKYDVCQICFFNNSAEKLLTHFHNHALIPLPNPYGHADTRNSFRCNVCRTTWGSVNSFHCYYCKFDLCPRCFVDSKYSQLEFKGPLCVTCNREKEGTSWGCQTCLRFFTNQRRSVVVGGVGSGGGGGGGGGGSVDDGQLSRRMDGLQATVETLVAEIQLLSKLLKESTVREATLEYRVGLLEGKSPQDRDQTLCLICMEVAREILFLPCNHIVLCEACSKATKYDECIICRAKVKSFNKVFFS